METKNETAKLEQLERQIQQLESALAPAHLKNICLESLLECVEEHYHIDEKKLRHPGIARAIGKVKQQALTVTVDQACHYFGYSRQAYYKQRTQQQNKLANEQTILAAVIEIRKQQPMIGSRKIQHLVKKQREQLGVCMGRGRLFTLLREHNLPVAARQKYIKTTNSYHRFRKYNNLIKELDITRPNQVYVADITYLTIIHGFCFLSLITDLFSRKIVGCCLRQSLGIDGCLTALRMALKG